MEQTRARPARAAAAVLLYDGDGRDLRVYLVERAPELRFFGGYHALPGGVRSPADGADGPDGDDLPALRRCAERELFEETGVLLDGRLRAQPEHHRAALRRALLAAGSTDDATPWQDAVGPDRAQESLEPLCRIATPPFSPVRYDTVFFVARLPAGETPSIEPGELVGGGFLRPGDALAAWRRGELRIVPPVLLLLELLVDGDIDGFRDRAAELAERYRAGALHRVQFSPGVVLAALRTPTLPPATTTNCLIVGTDSLWIIDPATPHPPEQERLFTLLDELGREGRRVAGVLVTHHHPDHVGAVAATAQRYRVRIHAHALTLERLGVAPPDGVAVADGDAIPLGIAPDGTADWKLYAMFTPGHDRGHLVFRESRYDAVIAGDMISTVSTVIIDPPEGHLRTYLTSLEKMLAAPMDTLYPAHGPAVPNGHRVVGQYLRHRTQRESALRKVLGDGPATAAELVRKVYWDVDPSLHALAERSLVAGLDKLVEDGHAKRTADGRWQSREDRDG